jgi:hypothetical protein
VAEKGAENRMQFRVYTFIGLIVIAFCFASIAAVSAGSGALTVAQQSAVPLSNSSGTKSYNLTVTLLGETYTVTAQTNSEVSDFGLTKDYLGVQFQATSPNGIEGYCDVKISGRLFGGDLSVLIDDILLTKDVDYTKTYDGTNYQFHITFPGGTHSVEVTSAAVSVSPSPSPSATAQPTASPTQSAQPTPTATPSTPSNQTAWVPNTKNAAVATLAATAAVGAVGAIFYLANASIGQVVNVASKKTKDIVSGSLKKWIEKYSVSKRKISAEALKGKIWILRKPEWLAYGFSIPILALAFAYVQQTTWEQFFAILPAVLLTSLIVNFAKTFSFIIFGRSQGAWIEHRLWYLGLASVLVTTVAFRMPLLTPNQNVVCGETCPKSLKGKVAMGEILVTLAFGGLFYLISFMGFKLIGGTGLGMCICAAFFNAYPVSPMKGAELYAYKKGLWVAVFAIALFSYIGWLLLG